MLPGIPKACRLRFCCIPAPLRTIALFACLIYPFSGYATVLLNETMASNGRTIADDDGDYEDWIELYNAGADAISLAGWGLSDDRDRPFRWVFPDIVIPPGEHLLVWASGKDRSDPEASLHTNFSIAWTGEEILLTRPDDSEADSLPPTRIPRDISFGRAPDGTDSWRYFDEPTPLQPNSDTGYERLLSAPLFSHAPGYYGQPIELHLHTTDSAVTLRYTLDGSKPTETSPRFDPESPIVVYDRSFEPDELTPIRTIAPNGDWRTPEDPVQKATVVRVRAFGEEALPSATATGTYLIGPERHDRYSFPVLSISTDAAHFFSSDSGIYVHGDGSTPNWRRRGRNWERPIHLEMFETDGRRVLSQGAGARIHGNASRKYPLKSLRLYARRDYGPSRFNYRIFPDQPYESYNRLILRNSGQDYRHAHFRDAFHQTLVGHLRFDTQAYRPSIVFINGEYWGIQNIRERYDRHYLERVHEIDPDNIDLLAHQINVQRIIKEGNRAHYDALLATLEEEDPADPEVYETIRTMMDLGNFIDLHIANIYLNNTDWPSNNMDYWRVRTPFDPDIRPPFDGRFRWLLVDTDFGYSLHLHTGWRQFHEPDFDTLSFAAKPDGPTSGYADANQDWPNPPWATMPFRRLLRNDTFRHDFISRFADQLNTAFHSRRATALLEEFQERIAPEVDEHIERWPSIFPDPESTTRGPAASRISMRAFAEQRPGHLFDHIEAFFDLAGRSDITFDVSDPEGGTLRINSVEINGDSFGLADPASPYPWSGSYFHGVPVTVEARPNPGFRFAEWKEFPDHNDPVIAIDPAAVPVLSARFDPDPTAFEPAPHRLADAPYTFAVWPADADPGTYPPHMRLLQLAGPDPGPTAALAGAWALPYNLESRSRIVGLDSDGLGFINTTNAQDAPGAAYVGAAILALDTRGVRAAELEWTGGTVLPNNRVYHLRLQYRLESTGPFFDFTDPEGDPILYTRSAIAGDAQHISGIPLPEEMLGRPYVQVAWRYHYEPTGTSGPRAKLRLDNITATATELNPWPPGSAWDDFSRTEDNRYHAEWFGTVELAYYPWVRHMELGWIYFAEAAPEQLWYWDAAFGWVWSSSEHFPYFFSFGDPGWFYFAAAIAGARHFWSFSRSEWIER